MSDPVAPRAEPMMAHMNKDHVDSMQAIVCHRQPGLKRPPSKVRMTAIDSKGFALQYVVVESLLHDPKGRQRQLRVPFEPAVSAASEVRARLVDMSNEAMQKKPARRFPIVYSMPRDLLAWLLIHPLLLAMGRPGTATSVGSSLGALELGRTVDARLAVLAGKLGGQGVIWLIYKYLVLAHIAEASAMTFYCLRRGASVPTTLKWAITHFFVGFTTYFNFLKINPVIGVKKGH